MMTRNVDGWVRFGILPPPQTKHLAIQVARYAHTFDFVAFSVRLKPRPLFLDVRSLASSWKPRLKSAELDFGPSAGPSWSPVFSLSVPLTTNGNGPDLRSPTSEPLLLLPASRREMQNFTFSFGWLLANVSHWAFHRHQCISRSFCGPTQCLHSIKLAPDLGNWRGLWGCQLKRKLMDLRNGVGMPSSYGYASLFWKIFPEFNLLIRHF